MRDAKPRMSVHFDVHVTLTEPEAQALLALTAYGDDAFLRAFYEQLGKTCLLPHEQGLRTLFKTSRDVLAPLLMQVQQGRDAMTAAQAPSATKDGG